MKPTIRLLSAAAVGVGVGVVAAVVIPTASSRVTEPPFRAPTKPLTIGKALPAPIGSLATKAVPGTMKIAMTRPDPAGGPAWALRVFTARAVSGMSLGNTAPTPAVVRGGRVVQVAGGGQPMQGRQRCAQLGRIVHGRFGWIDGSDVFHPTATTDPLNMTMTCREGPTVLGHDPYVASTTLVDRPEAREPTVRGSVVWGILGDGVTAAQLHTGNRSLVPARSKRDGTFLEFFGPARSTADVTSVIHYGKTVVDTGGQLFTKAHSIMARMGVAVPIDRHSGTLIARAPDPGGGPSWGALGFRSLTGGLYCLGSAGYLVDGRLGDVDAQLGVLTEPAPGSGFSGCNKRNQPTKRQPIVFNAQEGQNPGYAQIEPDRAALRLQSGRTLFWGETLPDVTSITLGTNRDVRTVIPSKPRNGFMVVYDGTRGLGIITATVRFEDGHTQTQQFGSPGP